MIALLLIIAAFILSPLGVLWAANEILGANVPYDLFHWLVALIFLVCIGAIKFNLGSK
jgi:hypothetical protein